MQHPASMGGAGYERGDRSRAWGLRAASIALVALGVLGGCGCGSDDPDDPCAGVSCGAHGRCVSDGLTAYCACDDGYTHDGLTCVGEDAGAPSDAGVDAATDAAAPDASVDAGADASVDAGPPPVEVCNGADDDGDGVTDEGCWAATQPMTGGRRNHTATLLADGRVLVVGGKAADGSVLASAEIFDPADESFSPVDMPMAIARHLHQAVRLADGRVLVVGGFGYQAPGWYRHDWASTASAEIFDPQTETWSETGSLEDSRYGFMMSPLPDGRVLAAGGFEDFEYPDAGPDAAPPDLVDGGLEPIAPDGDWQLDTAEVYDPATGTWSPTGTMPGERHVGFWGLLGTGEVVFAGGQSAGPWLASALLYDPLRGTWSETGPMPDTRASTDGHPAGVVLSDGTFLVAGAGGGGAAPASAAIFDPRTSSWSETGSMALPRANFTLTVLPDGRALAVGGAVQDLAAAELYDPMTRSWSPAVPLAAGRSAHSATLLADGRVLVCGGSDAVDASMNGCELYTPDLDPACRWSAPCGDLVCAPSETCATCPADCACAPGCGDGLRADGEPCDDGNRVDDDLCSNACVTQVVPANTTTEGLQADESITWTSSGNVVAAFVDDTSSTRFRRFDARGVPLDETDRVASVRALTTGEIAGLVPTPGGGFALVSGDRGVWPYELRGRFFDACGAATSADDVLLAVTGLADTDPRGTVVALPSGELLLVWASSAPDADDDSGQAILQQRFDATGAPLDLEPILTNTTFEADQAEPTAAALEDGGWVIAWRTRSTNELRFRRFGPDGAAAGDDVALATGNHMFVAALPGGGFVVVWGSLGCPGAPDAPAEVLFQIFDPAGEPVGELQQANTSVDGRQGPRSVAANAAGQILVLFSDALGCCGGCGDEVLRGRFFDESGLPLSDEIAVTDSSTGAAVALPDGSFLVAHTTGPSDDSDVALQRLPIP